jgi:CheY-like chemotaxis protein
VKNRVVVLVDDSADVRSSLAEVLRAEGFTVIEAADGREGVERTRAAMPDLVLMDLSLPVLDGAAAMRIIKSFAPTRGIPVVALTGLSLSPSDLLALGFDASLHKPCSPHALLECLAAVVSTRRRARR